jgi:hypothetical protein
MAKRVKWYAKGGGIARMGPFKSQAEASKHLKLAPQPELVPGSIFKPTSHPWGDAEFPPDAFVWPE